MAENELPRRKQRGINGYKKYVSIDFNAASGGVLTRASQ